jgi:hypothetical protein
MESTLIEAIQRKEVTTKNWDCKLLFKEEADGPYIDLLDYVNLSEEDKIPLNSSYPTFFIYKFPDIFNGLDDWPKLKKEQGTPFIWNFWGFASLYQTLQNLLHVAGGNKYHAACHIYQLYKEKVNLKRKYEEGNDYMDGIVITPSIRTE